MSYASILVAMPSVRCLQCCPMLFDLNVSCCQPPAVCVAAEALFYLEQLLRMGTSGDDAQLLCDTVLEVRL